MKKFLSFLLAVALSFGILESHAIVGYDLDNDGDVTINDAVYTLRVSAGIEYCDVNSEAFDAMDIDSDNHITLSDARSILLMATGITESVVDGISITPLPITFEGVTINNFSLNGEKATINVTNNTGKAIDSLTNISYKCYDSNGTILKTESVFLEDMNNGENCNEYFYIEKGTTKILFTDVTIYWGTHIEENETSIVDGLSVTTLPITFEGITINNFSLNGEKATINVTNNTGKAIDSLTNISYKCYDSNGTILKTESVFLEDMNNGENCNEYFYIEKGTTKILFTDVTIYWGTHIEENETSIVDGLSVTTLPITFEGITINNFSLNGEKATINVTNNTGKAIDSLTNISYKCYDSNGTILKTESVFLEDMNNGENCNEYFYIEKGTTKILFTDVTIYFQ